MNIKHLCAEWTMRLASLLLACQLSLTIAGAQTFTQKVQQHDSGEGTVTIYHDAEIDKLINAKATATPTVTPKAEKKDEPVVVKHEKPAPEVTKPKAEKSKAETSKAETSKAKTEKSKSKPQDDTTRQVPPQSDTTKLPLLPETPVDTSTTTSRHGYKITGYRVQAFAGGNTRRDRQKAEQTGNAMRQLLPGEDVYVRFYSPRWVCRVGNYRTYEEAREVMLTIRKLGYESATIVKGKIIVYNND